MEENVFPEPAVAGHLKNYVEARLHTDGRKNIERILQLQEDLARTAANPVYVLVDPADEREIARFEGATFDQDEFIDFLVVGERELQLASR